MKGLTEPEEDVFYKYPVLKIPTEKQGECLIIGGNKARAIIKHYERIKAFAAKLEEDNHDATTDFSMGDSKRPGLGDHHCRRSGRSDNGGRDYIPGI